MKRIGVLACALLAVTALLWIRDPRPGRALGPDEDSARVVLPEEDLLGAGGVEGAPAGDRVEALTEKALEKADGRTVVSDEHASTESLFDLWFAVFDESGAPLEDARMSLRSSAWSESRNALRREGDGYFCFSGVPAGPAVVTARAPGHATERYETFVPATPPHVEGLYLPSAARVIGSVIVEDAAARKAPATILYWSEGSPEQCLAARAAVDGHFVLDDVRAGTVLLVPLIEEFGLGEVTSLVLAPGEQKETLLHAPGSVVTIEGNVISTTTRRPPPAGGRVTVRLPGGVPDHAVETPRPSVQVDPQGRFRLRAVVAERGRLSVSAPGHSTRLVEIPEGTRGETIELGTIELGPANPLEVQLVSSRPIVGLDYRLRSEDGRFPAMAFDNGGRSVVADYPFEEASLILDRPDGNPILIAASLDEQRRIEVALDGDHAALVSFDVPPPPDQPLVLIVTHDATAGVELRRVTFLEDLSPVRVEGLPGAPFQAALRVMKGPALGNATGRFTDGQREVEVVVRASGARKTFHVVTSGGEPLAGATLYVVQPGVETVGATGITDASGSCSLLLPEGPLSGMVVHEEGLRTCIAIDPVEEIQRIEIDARGSIEITVELGGIPLAAAGCVLLDPVAQRLLLDPAQVGNDGAYRWERLHEGRYVVSVRHPSIATCRREVEVRAGETSRLTVSTEAQ